MSNAHSLNCLIIWILFHIVTYPNNSGLAPDWNETIEKYVTNRDGSITIDSDKLNEMIEEKVKEQYTYSTEEKKVGKWIDGKELYRKTFVYDTPTSGNATVLVGNIGEYDTAFIDYSSSFYINPVWCLYLFVGSWPGQD